MVQCNKTKRKMDVLFHCLKNKGHKTKHEYIDNCFTGKKIISNITSRSKGNEK